MVHVELDQVPGAVVVQGNALVCERYEFSWSRPEPCCHLAPMSVEWIPGHHKVAGKLSTVPWHEVYMCKIYVYYLLTYKYYYISV